MKPPKLVLRGEKELIAKLKRLGDRKYLRKVMRKSANAATEVLRKSVRDNWPEDTGLSKRSVSKKIIRTRAGYTGIVGTDAAAKSDVNGHRHVPAMIDHLIELGWVTPDGLVVPAIAPLRRGYESAQGAANDRFTEKLAEEIEKEASK